MPVTPARGVRLLERDAELEALGSYWAEALAGRGRFVFLGGEGGAGKTSLGFEFGRRIAGRGRFLVGACDVGATPRALGPLTDIADVLGLSTELANPEVRRTSLFPRVRAALGRTPTVFLLEDVHWADEATLDLVRYLARRMDDQPLLVIATFRDDEVTGAHPLAGVMGDLATVAGVSRMQLPLFTATAVAELAGAAGVDVDAAALHLSTGGNPFFVTEVLAAGSGSMPNTVRDAVRGRAGRLTVSARQALDAAAVVGPTAEIDIVLKVAGQDSAAVDECVQGGVLLDRGTSVAFRHELARQVIVDTIAPANRVDLHRRVLELLTAAGSTDHRRMAQHAIGCANAAAVLAHAPLAAELASRLGSHREAAEHLRTALRYGAALDPADRADLLGRLSYECYLTDQLTEALEVRLAAVALHESAGDTRRLGVGQRWLCRLSYFCGRNEDAKSYALAAVKTLKPLGSSPDLAMAYSNVAQLRMLCGSSEEALVWGRRALDEARATGNREVESHALNNIGTALMDRGDVLGGRALLEQSLNIAIADGFDEHAARAYTNIASTQATKHMLSDAERTLRTGIAYCNERDLDSWALYMQGWLAGVQLEQGHTDAAVRMAAEVLRRPQLSLLSRIEALTISCLAAVRAGDPEVERRVTELRTMADGTAESSRILPVTLLQAEAAWTAGRTADIVPLTDAVWTSYAADEEPWQLAELAWWRAKGGAVDETPFELPKPFALLREGRAREAGRSLGHHRQTFLGRARTRHRWPNGCRRGGRGPVPD